MTLLDKKSKRTAPIEADVFGFDAPNLFYAGFGLDVKEKLRNYLTSVFLTSLNSTPYRNFKSFLLYNYHCYDQGSKLAF